VQPCWDILVPAAMRYSRLNLVHSVKADPPIEPPTDSAQDDLLTPALRISLGAQGVSLFPVPVVAPGSPGQLDLALEPRLNRRERVSVLQPV